MRGGHAGGRRALVVADVAGLELEREVAGVPDPDGLHQKLRPAQDTFRRAIRGSAPAFRPYERRFADERSFSAPGFLENEDEPMEEDEEGKEIFIDEVLEAAVQ